MDEEKIKRILQEYREVEDKVRLVAEKYYWELHSGGSWDYYYDTMDNFKFDLDKEEVFFLVEHETSDGTSRDIYSFPLSLIFIEDDEELRSAIKEYIERIRAEAKVKAEIRCEEERIEREEEKRKTDFEEYLRLKEIFKKQEV